MLIKPIIITTVMPSSGVNKLHGVVVQPLKLSNDKKTSVAANVQKRYFSDLVYCTKCLYISIQIKCCMRYIHYYVNVGKHMTSLITVQHIVHNHNQFCFWAILVLNQIDNVS